MKRKHVFALVLGLAIVLLTGCTIGKMLDPGPSATVEEFAKAASDKDVDGMLDCCSKGTNDLIDGLSQLGGQLLNLTGMGPIDPKELVSILLPAVYNNSHASGQSIDYQVTTKDLKDEITENNKARVTGTWIIASSSGSYSETFEEPLELNLVKEDGKWKIDFTEEIYSALNSVLNF